MKKLKIVKKYLKENLYKKFIMFSITSFTSLIFMIKNAAGKLQFCVNF